MAWQIKYLLFHFLSSQQQQLDLLIFHFRLFNKFSSTRRPRYIGKKLKFESLLYSLLLYMYINTNIWLYVVLKTLTACWWIHFNVISHILSISLTLSLSRSPEMKALIWLAYICCKYKPKKYMKYLMMMHSLRCVVTNADLFSHERCNH